MFRPDRIRLGVGVGCVVLSGVAMGLIVSGGRSVDRAIRIEPALVEPTETPVENSKAEAVFTLVNGSSKPLLVKEARGTCGCMSVETPEGPLTSPRTLGAGERLPWRVSISTQGKSGPEEHGLQLLCEQDGKSISVSTVVRMVVQPTWHFFPPLVQSDEVAPNSTVTIEVGLYCGAKLPLESLDPAEVSPAGAMEWEWLDEPSLKPLPESIDVRGAAAARRRVLKMTMRAGDVGTSRSARVELFPKGSVSAVTSVSVICRATREKYELIPSTLVISSENNDAPIHRVVRCRLNGDAVGPLTIANCPKHLRATLREVDPTNWDIDVEIRSRLPGSVEDDGDRIEVCAGADLTPVCVLKVRTLGTTAP